MKYNPLPEYVTDTIMIQDSYMHDDTIVCKYLQEDYDGNGKSLCSLSDVGTGYLQCNREEIHPSCPFLTSAYKKRALAKFKENINYWTKRYNEFNGLLEAKTKK